MRSYSNFNFESAVVSLINLPFWTFERISAKFQMTIKCTILRVVICPFEHKLISYRYVTVPKQSPLSFNLLELAYWVPFYTPQSFSLFWNPRAYRVKKDVLCLDSYLKLLTTNLQSQINNFMVITKLVTRWEYK